MWQSPTIQKARTSHPYPDKTKTLKCMKVLGLEICTMYRLRFRLSCLQGKWDKIIFCETSLPQTWAGIEPPTYWPAVQCTTTGLWRHPNQDINSMAVMISAKYRIGMGLLLCVRNHTLIIVPITLTWQDCDFNFAMFTIFSSPNITESIFHRYWRT